MAGSSDVQQLSGIDVVEGKLRDICEAARRPRNLAIAVALLVLIGILVRLPAVTDEQAWFSHHADEATYFNQAHATYLAVDAVDGERTPLAHGGSGLPFLFEATFKWSGHEADGDPATWHETQRVEQFHDVEASPPSDDVQRGAALAYGLVAMLGAGVVVVTWLLARQVVGPLAALAATALVAIDPFQIFISSQLMTEAAYTLCIVASFACVFKARERPAWLLATAPLLAWAHYLRVNGVVMMVAVYGFAAFYLYREHRRRHPWSDKHEDKHRRAKEAAAAGKEGLAKRLRFGLPPRFKWTWVVAAVAGFWLLSAPYLDWRDDHLPSAFDYGTNSRFWADEYWNFEDEYWQEYSMSDGGPKESMSDYFDEHSLGDAADRVWTSFTWQLDDIFLDKSFHDGKKGHGDVVVLHPIVATGFVAALMTAWRRRELWFVPAAAVMSYAPVAWTYVIHDSPRYWGPVAPLAIIAAVVGIAWVATRTRWPLLVGAGIVGLPCLIYGLPALQAGLRSVESLSKYDGLMSLVVVMSLLCLVVATTPYWIARWRARS